MWESRRSKHINHNGSAYDEGQVYHYCCFVCEAKFQFEEEEDVFGFGGGLDQEEESVLAPRPQAGKGTNAGQLASEASKAFNSFEVFKASLV